MSQPDLAQRRIGRPPSCTCGLCLRCRKAAYMRAWYQRKSPEERRAYITRRDPDRVREVEKARTRTPEKQASIRRSQLRHPDRLRARRIVHNAVNRGRLDKRPCVVCGAERVEAHHVDYAKPLLVVWLCRRHHADRHLVDRALEEVA